MCQLRPSMPRPHPSFIVSVHILGKSTNDSWYSPEADPAADRCTTVPPETDVHVQGLSHRRLSGRDTAPRRTMPSPQLPLHPLWKPRYVSVLSTSPVSRLCLRGRYEGNAEGLHSLWRLQVAALCKLPGTASIDCDRKRPAGTEVGAYL
jgi:hypothetical protein